MSVRNLFYYISTQPLPKLDYTLRITGGAEVASLTGEGQQIFMIAVAALYPGKPDLIFPKNQAKI